MKKAKEDKTIELEFTQDLSDKLKHFCSVSACQILDVGETNRKAKYLAEEAHSGILMKLLTMSRNNKFTEKKNTDDYFFISCKNMVRDIIARENRLKRRTFLDFNNINISSETEDNDFVYELSDDNTEEELKEEYIQEKLQFIVDVLNNSHYIRDIDLDVFFNCFVDGMNYKEYSRVKKRGYKSTLMAAKRVKNVLNHLYYQENTNN